MEDLLFCVFYSYADFKALPELDSVLFEFNPVQDGYTLVHTHFISKHPEYFHNWK